MFELCDMTPEALIKLAMTQARIGGADLPAICEEILRRMSFAPLALSGIHDRLLTRKEVRFLLGLRDRKALWNMERRGLTFIRGEIRLSALADYLVVAEQRRKSFRSFRSKPQGKTSNEMPTLKAEKGCQAVTGNREGQVPTSPAINTTEPRPQGTVGGDDLNQRKNA